MNNLLFHLKVGDFRLPPRGVGKLTILDAHDRAFVELEGTVVTRVEAHSSGKAMRLRRKLSRLIQTVGAGNRAFQTME